MQGNGGRYTARCTWSKPEIGSVPTAALLSIQVGQPRTYSEPPLYSNRAAPWRSGFVKHPVSGAVMLAAHNLAGDGQADLDAHGGADKAVNAYPSEHYDYWITQGILPGFAAGRFGENFTVQGLLESQICIGDRFRIGAATVEVSQPRQPCWKLAHFMARADMVKRVVAAGRTGWYFRVVESGLVGAGNVIELLARPFPQWSLTEANRLMHHDRSDQSAIRELTACPALSQSWRNTFNRRLEASA